MPEQSDGWPPHSLFELTAVETAAAGLRRIMLEQVELASWHAGRLADHHEHLHQVRVGCKRARALLRLVRDGLDDRSYRSLNVRFRDLARSLSPARTAVVVVATLEDLMAWNPDLGDSQDEFLVGLLAGAAEEAHRLSEDPYRVTALMDGLHWLAAEIEEWNLPEPLVLTELGLYRTYRRGRWAMARALEDGGSERYHVWRKWTKYLRHQMEVLVPMRPDVVGELALAFARLGDLLGLDHDLTDLERTGVGPGLDRAIEARREELRAEITSTAVEPFARRPVEFVAELTGCWHEWRGTLPAR